MSPSATSRGLTAAKSLKDSDSEKSTGDKMAKNYKIGKIEAANVAVGDGAIRLCGEYSRSRCGTRPCGN